MMRTSEQVIQSPVRRRAGGGSRLRRGRQEPVAARHRRISAEHLFRIVKAVGIVAGVILLVAAYQPIASSSLFALKRVSITGHTRFPPSQAEAVVRDVMDGNVLKGDLTEVREQLKQRPLIKDVVVTRIWPDTLRVELIEREPVAVVALSSGKLVCVDQEGTVLGDFELLGAQPPLLGWDERRSTLSRSANQQRLQLYLELKQALSRSDFDYWNQVDQVNVRNLRDVVISLEHSPATEIHLGHRDFHQRFSLILNILEDLLRGQVQATYIDVSDPSRVVIRPPTRSSEPAPASRRVQ